MTPAVFGDLIGQADAHLDAAARYARSASGDTVTTATAEISRVAASLAGYLGDIVPYSPYQAVVALDMEPGLRAVADAREALDTAAAAMGPAGANPSTDAATSRLTAHLATAVDYLATGRDLLHSHFTIRPDGIEEGCSDWSAAILSAPVRQVMLDRVTRQCQLLALTAVTLTPATVHGQGVAPSIRVALAKGSQSLITAVAALASRHSNDRVTSAHTQLVSSIPLHSIPRRLPPRGPESVSELCDGATVSAVRLRELARQATDRDALSPNATAVSWRWSATAAAVVCHISQLTLASMAGAAAELIGHPHLSDQLDAAVSAADGACMGWRQVAAAWKYITTETSERNASDLADTSDMVARLGRLASTDPLWTPSRSPRIQLREPTELAATREQAMAVLSVLHHATDAIASTAAATIRAVDVAACAHRLYVPTRKAPEYYDVPHPYAPVPIADLADLQDAYTQARKATEDAASALDAVAISVDLPTRMLAAVRAPGSLAAWTAEHPLEALASAADLPDLVANGRRVPGPVEQAAQQFCPHDSMLLLRAGAIDKATRRLLSEAARTRQNHEHSRQLANQTLRQTAARTASESFPGRPATPATPGENPRAAVPGPTHLASTLAVSRPSRLLVPGHVKGLGPLPADTHGQFSEAAEATSWAAARRARQFQTRKPVQQPGEQLSCLEPCQVSTKAEVDTVAKGQGRPFVAGHVHAVGLAEPGRVAVGRANQQQDLLAGLKLGARDTAPPQGDTAGHLDR